MKKLVTLLLSIAMVLTMAVPAFAAETSGADNPQVAVTATAKPGKVQDLKVLKNGYNSLKLTWDKVDGATSYQVYRSKTGKSGSFALKKTVTGTTYSNIGITCGNTYYYKVRAVNKAGKGYFSEVKSNKVQPATAKISKIVIPNWDYGKAKFITEYYGSEKVQRYIWDVSKANSYRGFKVYWNKVDGATGYQLYRRVKGNKTWKFMGNYTGTTAKCEFDNTKEYEFKVRAYRTVNGKKVYGYYSTPSSYKFKWDKADLKKFMEDEIEKAGYDHSDVYVDEELGYEIEMPCTPENSGWDVSWPQYHSRYYAFDYITKVLMLSDLESDFEGYGDVTYTAYVVDADSYRGCFDDMGIFVDIGDELPFYYEVFLLRN